MRAQLSVCMHSLPLPLLSSTLLPILPSPTASPQPLHLPSFSHPPSSPSFLLPVLLLLSTSGSTSNPKRSQPCWITPVSQTYVGVTVLHYLLPSSSSAWHRKGSARDEEADHPRLRERLLPGCETWPIFLPSWGSGSAL